MRRILYFLAVALFFSSSTAFASNNIVENDTIVCPGTTFTLHGVLATPVPVSLSVDDQYSTIVPIGFPFRFYGTVYNDCIISSNGYISFNTANAGQYSAWAISQGIPGNVNVANSIMGHYSDILPSAGGSIDYSLIGTAPNRRFVVNFCGTAMFSCTNLLTSFQMVMNEADSTIEVHIRDKPLCTAWNSGAGIEGVQDATSTYATVVPGRNYPGTWTATNSSHKFTPTSSTNYSVASIPFGPYASTGGSAFAWYVGSVTGTPYATTQNITITATAGTTTYYLRSIHCQDTTVDSVKVTGQGGAHLDSVTKTNPTQCGGTDGTVTVWGLTPNHSYTLNYSKNGIAVPASTIFSNSQGRYILTGLGAGIYSNFFVIDAPCISNMVGPVTLVNPSVTADFSYQVNYGCSGDTVTFTNLSQTSGPLAYTWNFGDGTSSTLANPTHIYTIQGTYNAQLIASNFSTGGSCADTVAKNISLIHPIIASFTVSKDSACSRQSITFTNTSTATAGNGVNPQFLWDFGDGDTSTLQNPAHAFNNSGTYNVRLVVKNFVPCYDTAYHTIVIDSLPFVSFTIADSILCQGHGTLFTGNINSIGLLSYAYSFSDGGYNPNVNQVTHAFDSVGVHQIKLTAHYRLCPDSTYTATVTVHAYPNINLGPDTSLCPGAAGIPLYDHVSNPGATYLWTNGATTSGITATLPGTYAATVTQSGCSNTDTVEVLNDCYMNIPNVFTPNGDGMNEYFFPRQFLSRSVVSFKMDIYNRWGQMVYSTTRIDGRGWDGAFNDKPQPEGTYIYVIEALFENGKSEHHQGNVTLLR